MSDSKMACAIHRRGRLCFSKRVGTGLQAAILALLLLLTTGLFGSEAAAMKPASISINAPTTASGNVGQQFSWNPIANGAVYPITAKLVSGSVPPGTTFNAVFGSIYGIPTAQGVSTATVQISDADGNSAQATVTITINPAVVAPSPLAITSPAAMTVTIGNPVSFNLTGTGGTPPYNWFAGGLPAGLNFNSSTGVISGTVVDVPQNSGTFSVLIYLSDAELTTQAQQKLSVIVRPANSPPLPSTVELSSALNPANEGQSVSLTATASGGSAGIVPTGSVKVMDSSTTLGTLTLANGVATSSFAFSAAGTHQLTAVYAGDPNFATSTSSALTETITAGPTPLVASLLPGSRAVQLGDVATVFATMINTGADSLSGCSVSLPPTASAGLTLTYQTTSSATNAPTGTPNTPATIPGNDGIQSFVLSFQGTAAFDLTAMPLVFDCTGVSPAAAVTGVDTIDLGMFTSPVADVIALSATTTNNGVAEVPVGGAAAFAVASSNIGVTEQLTASVDTGSATLPVTATLCQTDSSTGQCLASPSASQSLSFTAGSVPTFAIFLETSGAISFNPGASRIFVRFTDANGITHGSTSVAIETQ